jgi:hypothetical protein
MATKLNGMLNLSKIPKELITTNKNGDKVIYVDIVPNKDGADQYGNTHSIQLYDKATKKVTYLGNVKPFEFGGKGQDGAPSNGSKSDDLPF